MHYRFIYTVDNYGAAYFKKFKYSYINEKYVQSIEKHSSTGVDHYQGCHSMIDMIKFICYANYCHLVMREWTSNNKNVPLKIDTYYIAFACISHDYSFIFRFSQDSTFVNVSWLEFSLFDVLSMGIYFYLFIM